jgi:hypothetical protein
VTPPISSRRLVGLALALAAAGCGRGPARVPVSGTVTLGGEPVPNGFVILDPDPAGGGDRGPQGHAPIRAGRFDTADGGQGVSAGPVVVRVQALGPAAAAYPQGSPLCAPHEVRAEVRAPSTTLELVVPESARLKAPPGGWVPP